MAGSCRDPSRGAPGKLKAAARHWAGSRQGGSDELAEDLEVLGLADQIKASDDAPFGVWPENATTARTFLELEFCWMQGRTIDGSTCMVIDPAKITDALELLAIKRRDWKNVFEGIKVMESAALERLHETR